MQTQEQELRAVNRRRALWACLLAVVVSILCQCSRENPVAPGLDSAQPVSSPVSSPSLRATLPASWDENWFSSPAVYDLDNDGAREIVASRHSVLYVWDHTGALRWRAAVGQAGTSAEVHGSDRMYCSPVVGDLDKDGYGEIAVCYGNSIAIYKYDGRLLPGWPRQFPGSGDEIRSLAASDLDAGGNGPCEILAVKTNSGPVTCVWNIDGTVRQGWPQVALPHGDTLNDYGGYNQNIGSADLDGDGVRDVVCTYDICCIGIFTAAGAPWRANAMFSARYSCNVPLFHRLDLAKQGWGADGNDRDETTDSPPVFADMDNDGLPEIVFFADHERAGEYVNRGNSLWALKPDMTRLAGFDPPRTTGGPLYTGYQDNIVQVAPSPCVTRLGGAVPHIIVPSYDGWVRCYDNTGACQWQVQFDAEGGPFVGAGEAVAGDLDNDGTPEIVFTTYSIASGISNLFILNAAGALLHRVPVAGRGSMSAPTLADVDNDGVLEIILSLKDALGGGKGGVQIWDVASAKQGNLDWPTGRGNYLRTGEMNKKN